MRQKNYKIIGVMSGTSLDGVDLAYVNITSYPQYTYNFIATATIPYTSHWQELLRDAIHLDAKKRAALDETYSTYLATVIRDFIKQHNITQLDAICSHGHTVLHQPHNGITVQIGNLPKLAQELNTTIVCDFRVQDVALGGQGAPLVPIGDQLFFSQYDYCLNLGGFANCSFENNQNTRIAYDICPANIVLNKYAQQLGKAYDDEGAFAKAGTVNTPLLKQLNAISYYNQPPPKSLGLEWVVEHIFPSIEKTNLKTEDILATFTEHIAIQLAQQFKEDAKVLITGGGAYNTFLLDRVKTHTTAQFYVPDKQLVEFKEALVFGLLGVLKLQEIPNVLSSVTGARQDHCSGKIYHSTV